MASETKKTGAALAVVEAALGEIRLGRAVVIRDDERTDLPADLIAAGDLATADTINLMGRLAGGPTRLVIPEDRCKTLGLKPLAIEGGSSLRHGSTDSIDARGLSTGVSAADRARTIAVAIDPATDADDLLRPGHVFPVQAAWGGVLEGGRTADGALDLVRLAGLPPAAVISEVLAPDGSIARGSDLVRHCRSHHLTLVGTADLIEYCRRHDRQVERVVMTPLPTSFGWFTAVGYRSLHDGREHVALVQGDVEGRQEVPAHIHSGCVSGDVFRSLACDCREQLVDAAQQISRNGLGVLVHVSPDPGEVALRHLPGDKPGGEPDDPGGSQPRSRRTPTDEEIGRHILTDLGIASARMLPVGRQAAPSTVSTSVP
ncbi:MAG: 3,4-dihydroxy-2-butanone-4-phosphate synthase [Actinobacteria bacterium]|nr:3,4-dihydroxy-2-butanone-4-phosphate synthase [Actinomycetota bacterium]